MTSAQRENQSPRSLIIDADPGIDDALALALALASPEVEVLAITTVAGNGPVELTTDNAFRLLRLFGQNEIPVAAGAARALVRVGRHDQKSPHGTNGLGEVDLGPAPGSPHPQHAVNLLASLLDGAAPASVTIAALGPLTNIALLLALHPALSNRIAELVVMGGSSVGGNITPVAEFNVWSDPEAAHRVLADSGLTVSLVGLDVTRRATIDETALEALRATSRQGALLAAMVAAYASFGADGWALHDVLALASIVDPSLVEYRSATVEIDTGLGPDRGRTCFRPQAACETQTTTPTDLAVGVDVDVTRFRRLVLDRIHELAETLGTNAPPPPHHRCGTPTAR